MIAQQIEQIKGYAAQDTDPLRVAGSAPILQSINDVYVPFLDVSKGALEGLDEDGATQRRSDACLWADVAREVGDLRREDALTPQGMLRLYEESIAKALSAHARSRGSNTDSPLRHEVYTALSDAADYKRKLDALTKRDDALVDEAQHQREMAPKLELFMEQVVGRLLQDSAA